jgi:glucosamine--fructose-6-phosphate aminotransferase (isomerizing)
MSQSTANVDATLEAQLGDFPDFMLKEIHEQPRVLRDIFAGRLDASNGRLKMEELPLSADEIKAIERIYIIACGTSYHAGLVGKDLIEQAARIPVEVQIASEFSYRQPVFTPGTLAIAISQSGETADTMEAVALAKKAGTPIITITNVAGSSMTKESLATLQVKANMEVSIAATKSYTGQLAHLALLALYLGQERGLLSSEEVAAAYAELEQTPLQVEQILGDTSIAAIEAAAASCYRSHDVIFIGRGVATATCYEAALKLKETSYVHGEGYAANEFRHGPIAMIDAEAATPVVAIAMESKTRDRMLTIIGEVKAYGGNVVALATEGDTRVAELADHVIYLPKIREMYLPFTAIVALQVFARQIALLLGRDIDHPRGLVKAVVD